MRIEITRSARLQYEALPARIQAQVDKQFTNLIIAIRHPSLHAKKYDERNDIWQARVNLEYRFYFVIKSDTYQIVAIIRHPK